MQKLETLKSEELEKVIYRPIVIRQAENCTEILRIQNDDDLTRIDFIYYPPHYYRNGGWAQIAKNTFIRVTRTKQRLILVRAQNIPIAPTKHYFKSSKDFLCYTLYFPPLPKGTRFIDIIECEAPGGNWFNFYGVSMERVSIEKLIVQN